MKKQNLLTLSHDYQMDKTQVLGKGSTGQVYFGKQISTGLPVAIKLIRLETIDNQVTDYLLRMQKIALTAINHQNVLRGMKIIENASKCYMITEYCNGGTLKQLIKKQGSLNQQKSMQILKGVLKGYSALARKKIVHRDLKPANIMFHHTLPKIIDFGYCQIQGYQKPSLEYNVGSPSYMAPESFQFNIYNEKTEIWAIGIILYECLMGKTFDDGKHMSEVFKAIKKFGIPFGKQISDKCRGIISWCLEFSPDKRPTAFQLLNSITQKKPNEPQFFILDKNRKKSNSLYTNGNAFQSSNLLTKRKAPVVEKKILSLLHPQPKLTEIQAQTLRRKISVKQHPKIIIEEIQRRTSRSNSKSNQRFGMIVQNSHQGIKKIETINLQTRQRINSNYMVKNEYGLNREPVFKTQKYFTGQNIQNKFPVHHISAFNSGLTSPREMQRKQNQSNYFPNTGDRNPESGKQRVSSKTSNGVTASVTQSYFDTNPSITYRPSLNIPQKVQKQTRMPIRKQNVQCSYIQKDPVMFTTRHTSQYYQAKPSIVKQSTQFLQNYQGINHNMNKQRPSSSIYQLNKILDQKQKPISIFRSGVQMAQKTYR